MPIEQAEVLYQKLKGNGNKTKLYIVDNGGHGNFTPLDNTRMNAVMIDFIREGIDR